MAALKLDILDSDNLLRLVLRINGDVFDRLEANDGRIPGHNSRLRYGEKKGD